MQHYGNKCQEKWKTMKNDRLPTLKFTVQTGDTPHWVTVPASTSAT